MNSKGHISIISILIVFWGYSRHWFDFDKVLGLNLASALITEALPKEVNKIVDERRRARENKDFKKSDELRKKIEELGYSVEDTNGGQRVSKK